MLNDLIFGGRPFDREMAHDHGLKQERLKLLLRLGHVRHVLHDVYVDARAPDDLAFRAACLRLKLPQGAVLSRLTAAWLLGVRITLLTQPDGTMPVECTVPTGREPVSRPGVRSYAAPLGGDVVDIAGLPCTSPVRTAVDLLRWLPRPDALAVVDAMAAKRVIDPAEVPPAVERFAGTRGVAQARYLAVVIEPLTESPGESWLRLRLIEAGFPRPEAQIRLPNGDGPPGYRLDMGWRRHRLAVEYDGEEFHDAPHQRARDERRRNELLDDFGWTVLGVGKGEVLGRSMLLERTVGGLLGVEPIIARRRW